MSLIMLLNIKYTESDLFLCVSNEQLTFWIKKLIPFTTASENIQYLRINLTKDVEDLYTEH